MRCVMYLLCSTACLICLVTLFPLWCVTLRKVMLLLLTIRLKELEQQWIASQKLLYTTYYLLQERTNQELQHQNTKTPEEMEINYQLLTGQQATDFLKGDLEPISTLFTYLTFHQKQGKVYTIWRKTSVPFSMRWQFADVFFPIFQALSILSQIPAL